VKLRIFKLILLLTVKRGSVLLNEHHNRRAPTRAFQELHNVVIEPFKCCCVSGHICLVCIEGNRVDQPKPGFILFK
jgi:hypothetical protein